MGIPGRPAAVTFLGWIFILVAVFMLVTGGTALGMVLIAEKASREGLDAAFEGAPAMYHVVVGFMGHFGAAAILQMVVAVAVLVAAVEFMRLRGWARLALEIFSWLSVLFVVSVGTIWVRSWVGMTAEMPPSLSAPLSPEAFAVVGAALWGALILVIAVCGIFVIKALRSETVKGAVS